MFAMARRKTHTQLAKRELNQSLEHFMQAAAHAAKGTGATVGPKVNAARDRVSPAAGKMRNAATSGWGSTLAALAPLATAVTEGARRATSETNKAKAKNARALDKKIKAVDKKATKAAKNAKTARKQSGKGGSKLGTLLLAGAAVGAGALVMRRRKQQQWDEYDPSRPMGGAHTEERSVTATTGTSTMREDTTPADSTVVIADAGDQTTSSMHSPTVARMAEGTATADDLSQAETATRRGTI